MAASSLIDTASSHHSDSDGDEAVWLPPLNTTLQHHFAEAERQDALLLPQFLSARELQQVLDLAVTVPGLEGGRSHCVSPRAPSAIDSALDQYEYDVSFGDAHVALNLHRARHFATSAPALLAKIVAGMRSQPGHWCDPAMALSVRCVELHTYVVGDGLMKDAGSDGHKDYGSELSMSILLSHAHALGGGQLMTWTDGAPVVHAMARGDALLFPSLKTHNVAPITHGERRSLVIELWAGGTNVHNRHT